MELEKKEKLIKTCHKYHLNFFVIAVALMALNALVYEVTAFLPLENHHLYMAIDDAIPLIPEFDFFYFIFYICPISFMYAASFFDKKKVLTIAIGGTISVLICQVVYLFYNVQMIRPESAVEAYWFFDGSITNVHEFFLAMVHLTYVLDPMARNGIPSLHALFSALIFMCGCPMFKGEKKMPLVLRILAIVFGLGIACSTFFVKQHYFIDAVIGFGLGIVMFYVAKLIVHAIVKKHPDNRTVRLLTIDNFQEDK